MKNIFEIMNEYGFEVPEDKKKDFEKAVLENYKTATDYEKQKTALELANEKLKDNETAMSDLQKKLDDFKDVDVTGLKKQIEDLIADGKKKDEDYQAQIADRDFADMLKDCISSAHGKNAKAIRALLDVDALKASKNQKNDIEAALKQLSEAEDSKFLFGETEPQPIGTGNPIGNVGGKHLTAEQKEEADCRAAMGLPPLGEKGDK